MAINGSRGRSAAFKRVRLWRKEPLVPLTDLFARFQQILKENNAAMQMIAEMEDKLGGEYVFDRQFLRDAVKHIEDVVLHSAVDLNLSAITNTLIFIR